MNKADINKIRKKLITHKANIDTVCGCYVSADKEVISTFRHSLGSLPDDEAAEYVFLFRKILTGEPGRAIREVEFSPEQVMHGAEHALLTQLRKTSLEQEDVVTLFYQNVIDGIRQEGNYLLLLMHYEDTVYYKKDDSGDAPAGDMNCVLCCVCPVKLTPGQLCFDQEDGEFHMGSPGWAALAPAVGFVFPAVENGADNIYKAFYYTKDLADNRQDFTDAVFNTSLAMPAREQHDALNRIMEETLKDECTMDAVTSVQEMAIQRTAEIREDREAPAAFITGRDVEDALRDAGVSDSKVQAFSQRYEEVFGASAALPAVNAAPGKLEVKLPDIVIRVSPEKSHLVSTRQEGDLTYIMIRADADVEVNGVRVRLAENGVE